MIRVPTEIVKSRTQTGAYGPGKSSWHSLVQTMRYEGIRGFYRGFGITIAREVSHQLTMGSHTDDLVTVHITTIPIIRSIERPIIKKISGW